MVSQSVSFSFQPMNSLSFTVSSSHFLKFSIFRLLTMACSRGLVVLIFFLLLSWLSPQSTGTISTGNFDDLSRLNLTALPLQIRSHSSRARLPGATFRGQWNNITIIWKNNLREIIQNKWGWRWERAKYCCFVSEWRVRKRKWGWHEKLANPPTPSSDKMYLSLLLMS